MLAEPSITRLGPDPAHRNCVLNGNAFQQDAVQSHNGWQYAGFYSSGRTSGSSADDAPYAEIKREPLFVYLSRRRLMPLHQEWETLIFDDYPQTTDDGHNTVQLGICPGDGTIHLSYDHHCDRLRYRLSRPGVASSPADYKWDISLFSSTLSHLPGLGGDDAPADLDRQLGYVTYPRFLQLKSDLLFTFRTGKAGLGDDHIAIYESATGSYNASLVGTNLKGVSNNPYIHGLDFRRGRLYATWVYRDFVWYPGWDDPLDTKHKQQAGPNSAANNHDICFTYASDDEKCRVWRNGAGEQIADLGRGESVAPDSPGITAFEIPKGSGLTNQEAQAVDHDGGVHVLNRDTLDEGGVLRWKHYYRSPAGSWTQHALPNMQPSKRGQLAVSKTNDLYFVLPLPTPPASDHPSSSSSGGLAILRASSENGYADHELVWQETTGKFPPTTEPLVDRTRLDHDNVLSVFTRMYRSGSSSGSTSSAVNMTDEDGGGEGIDVVILDFQL